MSEFNFREIKKSVSRKATELNVKTSMFIEINKIKCYISAATQEMERKYCDIGKAVYKMWGANSIELDKLEKNFMELKDCEEKIEEYNMNIQKIEKDNKKYMGVNKEDVVFCSQCGANNSSEAMFCRECGNKMEE